MQIDTSEHTRIYMNNHKRGIGDNTRLKELNGMKSMEYMPFFPSFSLFLYVSVWFTFSMLVKDNYVLVPNAVGIVLGLAQLIVYMIYKNKSSLSILKSMSVIEDKGSNQVTSLLFYTFY
ncbi:hypothetical protein TEA_026354 [Camellia sinensis var. sinensis]|uniref:Bidirectional sugar transporter SWEET n=1 Tax=Camellia sinensis var. sinensis TaxID=542762 RepID=A0A4S4F3I6_CAMSN|nr:hypothetical protein TEA_026354 [Camellia sinensis var. sinensis]